MFSQNTKLRKISQIFTNVILGLSTVIAVSSAPKTFAVTPLTKAEIQKVHNVVQFIPKDKSNQRPARKADTMTPGDGVSTGRSSLVDLRFNDGSLARVGEQAIFKFLPKTRDVELSNGTLLLLIPPGKGQTNLRTPNAAAAIRGSALFVRHNPETNTSIIGALTNSKIEVFDQKSSQSYVLEAGQLMVVVEGKFAGLYDFDLKTFYQNSNLIQGLNLDNSNPQISTDPALIDVKAEINQALVSQPPVTGKGVINNPPFARNIPTAKGINNNNNPNAAANRKFNHQKHGISVDSIVDSAKVVSEDQPKRGNFNGPGKSDGIPGGGNSNKPGNSGNNGNNGNNGNQGNNGNNGNQGNNGNNGNQGNNGNNGNQGNNGNNGNQGNNNP